MKIKLLPFDEAVKKSKNCCKHEHWTITDKMCLGIQKNRWKDNAVLEVKKMTNDGYFFGADYRYYCESCCEVIEE